MVKEKKTTKTKKVVLNKKATTSKWATEESSVKEECVADTVSTEVIQINFYTLRSLIVWTVGFVLIIGTFLERLLISFYKSFPLFCEDIYYMIIGEQKEGLNYVVPLILILPSIFLSLYFCIKLDKYKFPKENFLSNIFMKMPNFIRIVLFYILFSIICFVIFLPIQYTLKKTTGITFCSVLVPTCFDNKCVDKPIIYLYPTETTNVSVKLGAPEKLTHTYPKYINEWKVRAEPNGNLTDEVTGRSYYSLYWEGKDADFPHYDDGFVVAKEDIVPFLEEKLAFLGLNERETNEFIIYWLPKLESAPYTFVHFVSQEEQDKNMSLSVQPKPDTVIRVLMAFKTLDKPIEVKEQILPKIPERNGFTVIEWGGTEISSGLIK